MREWISGNTPEIAGTYFITTIKDNKPYTPWEIYQFNGKDWSREPKYKQTLDKKRIIAYMPCNIPLPYEKETSEEDRCEYFVKITYDTDRISFYGKGMWPHPEEELKNGFDTVQKARAALCRRRKLDVNDGYFNLFYSVVDNTGAIVPAKRRKKTEEAFEEV